jgi:uncharacterized protein (TIGR03435 family)
MTTRILTLGTLLVASLHHGHCEDLAKAPAFEVASITPCKPGTPANPGEHMGLVQFTAPGGRFKASATTVKFLLEWAYGMQQSQHSGGPAWIDTERYDIVAKAEGNATDAQMKLMVQTLLADRFQLKMRHEKKELTAYVLSVGKTPPKLFPPKEGETRGIRVAPVMGADQKANTMHVIATRFSLAQLCDTFSRQMGAVMVNQTGLDGEYDFALDLTPDEIHPSPVDPSLLMAGLREQLGLVLKSQKTLVDYWAIEGAERVVAGN